MAPVAAHKSAQGKKKRICDGTKYSKADVMMLKQIFDKHDEDRDGKVTVTELIHALEAERNLSKQELSAFRTIDMNKDGVLTFNEYLRRLFPYANDSEFKIMMEWACTKKVEAPEPSWEPTKEQMEDIRKLFHMYDKNGNGTIERKELIAVAENCGYEGEDVELLFDASDLDHNGTINFDEFVELMRISYI